MSQNLIPIIIPSYEPDERLLVLLEALFSTPFLDSCPVILVDDGSGEKYNHFFEAAKSRFGVTVLVHEVNKGKGRALKDAFSYCLTTYPNMVGVVTADSDGQHTPADIIKCMDALLKSPEALILGSRDFSLDNVPPKSKFGNNLTSKVFKTFFKLSISDTQTGLRAIPRSFMTKLLDVEGERFEYETYMLLESKGVCPIIEVPIETVYDSTEHHQTHFNPVLDSIRIYGVFFARFIRFAISSLSSAVLDFILFWIFCRLFKVAAPVYYVAIATICARVLSATYNYIINRVVVFKSKESGGRSFVKYAVLAVLQMLLSSVFVTLGVNMLLLPEVLVKLVVDTTLFIISYFVQKRVVFINA